MKTIEVPVKGMDCAECTQHVQHAIAGLAGVESVNVYLGSEKAVIRLDPTRVEMPMIRKAVADAGYSVPDTASAVAKERTTGDFTKNLSQKSKDNECTGELNQSQVILGLLLPA